MTTNEKVNSELPTTWRAKLINFHTYMQSEVDHVRGQVLTAEIATSSRNVLSLKEKLGVLKYVFFQYSNGVLV